MPHLSRGAQRCLDLLKWYSARFRDVYPLQSTIAAKLGKSTRQVRHYLAELKSAGLVDVRKAGPNPATYIPARCSPKKKPNYGEYLQSSEWAEKRALVLKRDHFKCQICNSSKDLHVHHRSYKNLGNERETGDLITLCAECHALFHKNGRLQ